MKLRPFVAALALAVPSAAAGVSGSATASPAGPPVAAPAPDATSTLAAADGAVGSKVVITDLKKRVTIRHDLTLSAGSTVTASGASITVRGANGVVTATITGAVARDEHGRLLPSTLTLNGKNVIQRIDATGPATGKVFARLDVVRPGRAVDARVNGDLADKLASLDDAPPSAAPVGASARLAPLGAAAVPFVAVPADYVYDLTLTPVEWHDYCSYSPDSWFSADFRGPCARHDMAYMAAGRRVLAADDQLKVDLDTNCSYAYGKYNPNRYTCYGVATVYHDTVAGITQAGGLG